MRRADLGEHEYEELTLVSSNTKSMSHEYDNDLGEQRICSADLGDYEYDGLSWGELE
jgi:hypothetical protein